MTKSPQLRFTRLKLINWRNFRQVDIALGSRAFFVGPNASGKSNLLDAFRFLGEVASPGSGGLQAAILNRQGFAALRCLHARRVSDVEIDIDVGNDSNLSQWRYSLKINNVRGGRQPTIIKETIEQNGTVVGGRTRDTAAGPDDVELSQTLLEQVSANKDFRVLVDFLASCRYLHVVPQIVRDRGRAKIEGDDPYGGDLIRRIKAMPKKSRLPRLTRLSAALKLAVPQFDRIDLEDDANGVPHLRALFAHWRASGSRQTEVAFSDGTLRLIGLLWSISERGGPLLLEEPELSLNDAVVNQLPRMFARMQRLSGRQVITTTHSTALLNDTGIGLTEIHRIVVDANGSSVQTANLNPQIAAQVAAGMTASEAILPLLSPENIDSLGNLDIAS